jgi:GNAT superfamily N-acetyltransferase
VRIRQAGAGDLGAVRELVQLAGVELDDETAAAVTAGSAGAALRAGLRGGREGFTRHMAEQFFAHPAGSPLAYLSAALVLVAEDREHGIVGALVACPPPNVAAAALDQTERKITDPHVRGQMVMSVGIGLAKIQAVAVAEHARGRRIGGALLALCSKVYLHCGYKFIYGQMADRADLERFYRRHGFDVLDEGEPVNFWVLFGFPSYFLLASACSYGRRAVDVRRACRPPAPGPRPPAGNSRGGPAWHRQALGES